jgi:hypothetical protein
MEEMWCKGWVVLVLVVLLVLLVQQFDKGCLLVDLGRLQPVASSIAWKCSLSLSIQPVGDWSG